MDCNTSENSLATQLRKGGGVEGSDFSGAAEGPGRGGAVLRAAWPQAPPLFISPVHIFRAFCYRGSRETTAEKRGKELFLSLKEQFGWE